MKQAYEFTETVWVDDLDRNRREIALGTIVTAELENDTRLVPDRLEPAKRVEITIPNMWHVTKSDANIHPGCLTSCIRSGRMRPVRAAVA